MKFDKILQQLEDLIQSRSILNHPFYVAWQQGELTKDQLALYAKIYYPHVAAFPRYLRMAIQGTDDEYIKRELQDNLDDELTNPKPHDELWIDFTEEFGLRRSVGNESQIHPAAKKIVRTFEKLARKSAISALTALYAYESQQPEVARQKADGLRQLYGVDNPKSLAYFEVHAETDIVHSEGERNAIDLCLQSGASPDEMIDAANEALDAYWGLLDGICEEAGIAICQ